MELSSCTSINDENLESWMRIRGGGFGQIYKAKHTKWGMDVAVKILHYNDGSDSSLLHEADLMRHGGNPNVLRILGVYVGRLGRQNYHNQLGLVMEYMEKGSVADLLQALGGPPLWPLAFRITHQIALGMNFLHQLCPPLFHLDLKPNNVLLDDSLNAKLTDFGLAKLARSSSNASRGQDEEVGGTTSYMPPEAFQDSYTPAFSSDVYSYGVLLWSVVTGKEPYQTPFSSLVRFRVREGDRPDLRSVDSRRAHGISDLIDLMKLCWDGNPTQRPDFIKCVNVTEKVFDLHKQDVPDAVCATLKKLDSSDTISSNFKSLALNSKPNNACAKEKSHHSVNTEPTPIQEKGGIAVSQSKETGSSACPRPRPASSTNHKPAAKGPQTNQKVLGTQRQISSPGGVNICLSNLKGVQIGNNNYMNINGSLDRPRQRHPTAPSRVDLHHSSQSPRHHQNPDHTKP